AQELVARTDTPSTLKRPDQVVGSLPSVTKPETKLPSATPEQKTSWWPKPVDLLARFDRLRAKNETRQWAEEVESVLDRLTQLAEPTSERLPEALAALRRAANDVAGIDESRLDSATAIELRLARHALQRRLDIWESLSHVLGAPQPQASADSARLEVCLVD